MISPTDGTAAVACPLQLSYNDGSESCCVPALCGVGYLQRQNAGQFDDGDREVAETKTTEPDADKSLAMWRNIFGPRFPASGRSRAAGGLLNEAAVTGGLTFPDRPVVPRKPGGFA